jgi:hypothetical protein
VLGDSVFADVSSDGFVGFYVLFHDIDLLCVLILVQIYIDYTKKAWYNCSKIRTEVNDYGGL